MLTGGIPPASIGDIPPDMKTVVSIISVEEHAALKQRAKDNRRSLGAQLAAEAFAFAGMQAPDYIAKPSKRKGAKSK